MRFAILMLLALSTNWGASTTTFAAQPAGCQQCSDQRRACMANYSAKTCQTEYDRCIKECQRK
jgi:hypothetical protein